MKYFLVFRQRIGVAGHPTVHSNLKLKTSTGGYFNPTKVISFYLFVCTNCIYHCFVVCTTIKPSLEAHSSATVTSHLQDDLDSASLDMNVWTTALPFIVRQPTCHDAESLCVNILDYVNPIYRKNKLYFCARYDDSDLHHSVMETKNERSC